MQTSGSIEGRNFSRHYRGPKGEKAFLTCNRDAESLLQEAEWDRAVDAEKHPNGEAGR
jgi:hypothetical protein